MNKYSATQIAARHGLKLSFDPRSDGDFLHPPDDTENAVFIDVGRISEADFVAACESMRRLKSTSTPASVAPVASATVERRLDAPKSTTAPATIYGRLLQFQKRSPTIHKNCTATIGGNRQYRYADLASVLDAVRPVLADVGLVLVQSIDDQTLTTSVIDSTTGERMESRFPLHFDGQTWHQIGSAISYARRYAVLGLLGLCADDDDDAVSTLPTGQERRQSQRQADPTCDDCGESMRIGRNGQPYCHSCWQRSRPEPARR